MNIFTKQLAQSFLLVFTVMMITSSAFIAAFPQNSWGVYLEKQVADFPFAIFLAGTAVTVAFLFGLWYGWIQWSGVNRLGGRINRLIAGKDGGHERIRLSSDHSLLEQKLEQLEQQIVEQKLAARRLASEKTENQEKLIQQMVSQERQRLARELHDSVSQQLFAASMMMSAVNENSAKNDPAEVKQLAMVEKMIQQSQLEMRALLLHLRPVALNGKSLREGIEDLLRELSQKITLSINCSLEDIPMDRGMEDHLFRIVQESISNTLRHAKAEKLDVLNIWRDGFVILRISDDGVGFDVNTSKAGSYGLQNMYERALEIGGSLKIISLPNKGTRLEVKVPLTQEERLVNESKAEGGALDD